MVRSLLALSLATAALAPSEARACATCAVGDPTLTTLGAGQPARGRLRGSLVLRHHEERLDTDGGRWVLRQERYELGAIWTPLDRWMLRLVVPFAHQRVRHPNLARTRRWSLGDVALHSRAVIFRDRALAPRHLLLATAGLELPTASRPAAFPDELHAGSASWDAVAGLDYLVFRAPWSAQLSARAIAPMAPRHARAHPAVQTVVGLQLQPLPALGGRLTAQLRHEFGAGGGTLLRVGGGLVAAPVTDLVLHLQLSFPAWQTGSGAEDWTVELGGTVDF